METDEAQNIRRATGYAHAEQASAKMLWYRTHKFVVTVGQPILTWSNFAEIVGMSLQVQLPLQ